MKSLTVLKRRFKEWQAKDRVRAREFREKHKFLTKAAFLFIIGVSILGLPMVTLFSWAMLTDLERFSAILISEFHWLAMAIIWVMWSSIGVWGLYNAFQFFVKKKSIEQILGEN